MPVPASRGPCVPPLCMRENVVSARHFSRSARVGETFSVTGAVEQGREAFERRAWADAWRQFSAAGVEDLLELEDWERLAVAAYLVGRSEESVEAWTRAHHECVRLGDVARAARCAFLLAFGLLNGGDLARGG